MRDFQGYSALLFATFVFTFMGVVARELDAGGLSVMQQVFARVALGWFLMLPLLNSKVSFKNLISLPRRDYLVFLFKGTVAYLSAYLFSRAILETSFVNVSIILLLPLVALFGIIRNADRLTPRIGVLLCSSIIGALLVFVKDFQGWTFGFGEMLALVSAVGFAFSYISRKRFTKRVNDYEIIFGVMFVGMRVTLPLYLVLGGGIERTAISPYTWLFVLIGGLSNIVAGYLKNYASGIIPETHANVLMNTEVFRALLIGIFWYKELLTIPELAGGVLIVLSSLLILKK